MSTLPVPIQNDAEVRAITKQAADVLDLAAKCVVTDTQGAEWATAILGEITTAYKAAEERRVFFVKPLNDHVDAINAFFKQFTGPLTSAKKTVGDKILAYRATERRRLAEEQTRLRIEADAREAEARALLTKNVPQEQVTAALDVADAAAKAVDVVPSPPAPTVKTAMGSTTARRVIDFEVLDKRQVPHDYLQIDVPSVREAIRSGVRSIPGLRIYEKEVLAVKT